jgi:hypothetical protein
MRVDGVDGDPKRVSDLLGRHALADLLEHAPSLSWSDAFLAPRVPWPELKMVPAPAISSFRHWFTRIGWMLNRLHNWLAVMAPRTDSRATLALNASP